MNRKQVIHPQRIRRIPPQFSWLDHRLVRDDHIRGRSAEALALYLFLVTVGDARGLSWYSDISLCQHLSFIPEELRTVRRELKQAGLVAYRKPVYQVLDLAPVKLPPSASTSADGSGQVYSIGEVIGQMMGGSQ